MANNQAFNVRSISLPSRSHPAAAKLEEDLRKLRACLASSSSTTEAISDGLRRLGDVYNIIEEILRLPSNHQLLAHSNKRKWVEEELEVSLRLLDLSGTMRDGLASTKEHLQQIQLSCRRQTCIDVKGQKAHHHDSSHLRSTKKAIVMSMRSLRKQMERSNKRSPRSAIDFMLAEAREMLISLLQLVCSFLVAPRMKKKGGNKWFFVVEMLNKKKVVCEESEIGMGEELLDNVCDNIFCLESGLESLFRRLIQNRVSLLNMISF